MSDTAITADEQVTTTTLHATQTYDDPAEPVKIEITTSPDEDIVYVGITVNPYTDLADLVAQLGMEPEQAIMIGHALIQAGQRVLDAMPQE